MKLQCAVITLVGLLLAMLTITGTVLTEHFPQAAEAHAVGFDALAHSLFDDAVASRAGAR